MAENANGVDPQNTENQGGAGVGETLPNNPPSEGSSQIPQKPKPNPGENAYEKGHRVGQNDFKKSIQKKLSGLIDLDNIDESIEKLRSLVEPEPSNEPGQQIQNSDLLKELQKRLKETDGKLKKAEEEKESIRKEERIKYEIRKSAGTLNPYDIEDEVDKFFQSHSFDDGKDGLIIRDKLTGKPLMDGGDFLDIESAVKAFANKRLWAYKALSQGGAGIQGGERGGHNLDINRIKAGDSKYIQAHRQEIKEAFGI